LDDNGDEEIDSEAFKEVLGDGQDKETIEGRGKSEVGRE